LRRRRTALSPDPALCARWELASVSLPGHQLIETLNLPDLWKQVQI
jgi:hypothetical protein